MVSLQEQDSDIEGQIGNKGSDTNSFFLHHLESKETVHEADLKLSVNQFHKYYILGLMIYDIHFIKSMQHFPQHCKKCCFFKHYL